MAGNKNSGKPRYNAEVHETIVNALRLGAFKAIAAQEAGISVEAMEKWLRKGRRGVKRYARFARDCDKVMSRHAQRLQAVITKASMGAFAGDWKAAAWDLERRFPKVFGKALEPAVGVTFGADGGEQQKTRVEFYIPDNGRRPVEET